MSDTMQTIDAPCATCGDDPGARPTSYVYALGRIEARFPTLAIEKEFAQASGRTDAGYRTDQQLFHDVLTRPGHRYLARQLCWVFTVQGLETYLLEPVDPADLDLLLEAIRPSPTPGDMDCIIGIAGGIAPPDRCNGLMVPIVAVEQTYSFDRAALVGAVPRPDRVKKEEFAAAVEDVVERIVQLADKPAPPTSTAPSTTWRCAIPASTRSPPSLRPQPLAHRRRGAAIRAERDAAHRRGDLQLHAPGDRRRRAVVRARRRDGTVSVPRQQAVALHRAVATPFASCRSVPVRRNP